MVCCIHSPSRRSGKSSWAWAPRDSLRASAACMVAAALGRRLRSSRLSTRSVFQMRERSLRPTSLKDLTTASILVLPSASESWVRYTAAWSCMVFCMSRRISEVGRLPEAWRSLSRSATVFSPALAGSGGTLPFSAMSAMRKAQARPKTTMSSSELAPSRFAPCTDAQATSPAAKRPGTTASWSMTSPLSFLTCLITSPKWFVGTPPML
mmetsp:Transcript_29437/g.90071  ORF Transcript_29437/g.90071 Transcript_29437/m.90071 type:complete len:209 (-) Transcript_29437:1131-1757(-)